MAEQRRDQLFATPHKNSTRFVFDERVADVFADMILRSVPGYATIVQQCGELAARFVRSNSRCYDLGCSLGATTLSMAQNMPTQGTRIIAVDNAPAMIDHCQRILDEYRPNVSVSLVQGDICETAIENASMAALNFTLQFIAPEKRSSLLARIYHGLNSGGCLIISEKIQVQPPELDVLMIELHHQFKRTQGYSDLEISQKRDAIENVLIPETLTTHLQRLSDVGFKSASVWFQCYNFCSIIAIK